MIILYLCWALKIDCLPQVHARMSILIDVVLYQLSQRADLWVWDDSDDIAFRQGL